MLKKKSILDKLFLCIILNLIPSAMLGVFHISNKIYTILYGIVYIIQTILLFLATKNAYSRVPKKIVILLVTMILNCGFAITYTGLKFGNIDYNEIIFSFSFILNILIMIIGVYKEEIKKVELIRFLENMSKLGIIASLINILLNYKIIMKLSTLTNSYNAKLSSFFPNRNQFGTFMLMMIISISLLLYFKRERKYYIYCIIFIINLVLSMSRNAILSLVIYGIILIYLKYIKGNIKFSKSKIVVFYAILIVLILLSILILKNQQFMKIIETLFIRADSLESGSGRFDLWKNGLFIFTQFNPFFGVGRFKAIQINKELLGSDLDYFHSIYVEKLACHGIIGILTLYLLFKIVWKKIAYSNIDKNVKDILKAAFICFLIISMFETTTRFSIGYADTMSLIFFFTFPILVSNLKNDN